MKTAEKQLELLEQMLASEASAYYKFNLTQDLVPGTIYETVEHQQYAVNERIGLPSPARFSEVIAYWGNRLPQKDQDAYFAFFDRTRLLERYRNGERQFRYTYWTTNVLGAPLLAEQHIALYEEEETGDILGFTCIFNRTEQEKRIRALGTERQFLDVLCRDYTTVHYVDLKQDSGEPLKIGVNANASRITRIRLRKQIAYTENIRNYCDLYVVPEDREKFLQAMDREHLLRELAQKDRFVHRYKSLPNAAGHRYFEVEVVRLHEEQFDGTVIVAFRHIDELVKREWVYQQDLEKLAYSDALTGIGNRAAFRKELSACEKYVHAACVVADVNNLKLCNDRYGHQEGDRLITDAAVYIRRAFQNLGECFRIGGDEFCVLMPHGEEGRIQAALRQMHDQLETDNPKRTMPLSIAVGYAIRQNPSECMEQLFNRGDEMMYDVKYRMKKKFPVYCEERIKNYLNVLRILSKSTDAYLYLWDIAKDENWFFGNVSQNYALRDKGKPTNSIAEMEEIIYPLDRAALHEDLRRIAAGEKQVHDMNYRWVNRQGEAVWISCRGMVIPDDKGKPFVMIGRVSDKTLRYLYHPLTKLFNKNKLMQDMPQTFFPKNTGFWMLIGIDHFSSINLRHGWRYGDQLLKHCAEVLEHEVSPQNIWHVETNCFALYLDVRTEEAVRAVYNDLLEKLKADCTLSAGVVPNSTELFQDVYDLYTRAEVTFEKAKNGARQTLLFFSPQDLEP